jgi:hypothetical protein
MHPLRRKDFGRISPTWRLGLLVAVAVLTMAGAVVASPSPASANATVCSYQGDDYACTDEAGYLWVCDVERDGHSVYAEYRTNSEHGYAYDQNGSTDPCTFYNPAGKVQEFRVCEEVWGPDWCGDWRDPWW